MPQINTITLNDSSAAPFDWDPLKIDGNLASWHETARFSGIAVGESLMTVSVQRAAPGGKVNKVRAKLVVPYLDADNALKYSLSADMTFLFPVGCSLIERQDTVAFAKNLLDSSVGTAAGDLANYY